MTKKYITADVMTGLSLINKNYIEMARRRIDEQEDDNNGQET